MKQKDERKDLPEAFLATNLAVLGTIATPTIGGAAGTSFGFHRITVPAVILASTDLAAGIVLGERDVVAFDVVTGQSSRTGLKDGIVGSDTGVDSRPSGANASRSQQYGWGEMHKMHGEAVVWWLSILRICRLQPTGRCRI